VISVGVFSLPTELGCDVLKYVFLPTVISITEPMTEDMIPIFGRHQPNEDGRRQRDTGDKRESDFHGVR
jgi:hypothetical protein